MFFFYFFKSMPFMPFIKLIYCFGDLFWYEFFIFIPFSSYIWYRSK